MSPRIDRLEEQIQQIQQWIVERVPRNSSAASIQESLEALKRSLKPGKLILNIVSSDQIQAHAFLRLLNYSSLPQEQVVAQVAQLPDNLDFEIAPRLPALIRQDQESPIRYELPLNANLTLGRNPDKAKILLEDEWSLISGVHAELQPLPEGGWRVQDADSRNGTFINGQRLRDWHRLETGDRLCLGSASGQQGSVTLVYDQPKTAHFSPTLAAIYQLFNCNALCLIVDLSQSFSEAAKHLLEQINKTPIRRTFLIAAMPRGADPNVVEPHLTEMQLWLHQSSLKSNVELIPLSLEAILPRPGATQIMPYAQPEFEQLSQSLREWAQGNLEEMTLRRVAAQLQIQLSAVESVLNEQALLLRSRIQQDEDRLQSLTYSNLKEQFNKTLTRISGEKDHFFRQIKSELGQSKSNLLDEFRRKGLPARIKKFVKRLKPVIVDQGGYRHVRLHLGDTQTSSEGHGSIHLEAIHLCRSHLAGWAIEEWRQICLVYGTGGLRSLLQRSYESLNSIPNLKIPTDLFQIPELPDVQPVLQVSVLESPCGVRYKQMGLAGYLYKNIKGLVISGVALIVLVSGVLSPIVPIPENLRALASGPLLVFFTLSLFWTYQQEKRVKIEEVTEKLQKEITDHYCALTKNLTERVLQHLNFVLEGEERRLREALETAKDLFTSSLNDLEKNQAQLRTQIEEGGKIQQRIVSKDIPELHQLKRSLLNSPNENSSDQAEVPRRAVAEAGEGKRPSFSRRKAEAS